MSKALTQETEKKVLSMPQPISRLSEHLLHEQFSVALQPRVNVHTQLLHGFEVFARWQHPQRGYIAPAQFIHIAESQELIDQLTFFVIEQAAPIFKQYNQSHALKLSINISPLSFRHPDFLTELLRICEQSGLKPKQLILDFPESVVTDDFQTFSLLLDQFREAGFLVALDDFGTSDATALNIDRMHLHELKLDYTITKAMVKDKESRFLAQSAITVARHGDVLITAECIEDQDTLDLAKRLGVDIVQGYFIGKPMFKEELANWWQAYQKTLCNY